jgi:hypothetical protein
LGHGHKYHVSGTLNKDGHSFTARINDQTFNATGAQYNNQFHVFVNGQHAQYNLPEVYFVPSLALYILVTALSLLFCSSPSRLVVVRPEAAVSRRWLVVLSKSIAKPVKK